MRINFGKWDDLRSTNYVFSPVIRGKNKFLECQNIITFDIETSNGFRQADGTTIGFSHDEFKKNPAKYTDAEPVSLMYVWQCAVENGSDIDVYLGRTWEEFKIFLYELTSNMGLVSAGYDPKITGYVRQNALKSVKKNPISHIYIHNLGFEFQHLRNIFDDEFSRSTKHSAVFARSMRKTMKAEITYNKSRIVFNDTLCLTQKSLASWCRDEKLPVQKLSEPKDFYLPIRTPETPLTQEEIDYSINDVVSMVYGMKKYRDKYQTLNRIPMTQTGEVRRRCKREIAEKNQQWSLLCMQITMGMSFQQYKDLYSAFVGGWTHANALYAGRKLKNVRCFDFRSSYPAVMVSRRFPISEFVPCDEATRQALDKQPINQKTHLYYINFTVENVETITHNTFWSSSKCSEIVNPILDNGKIYSCEKLTTTMTDLDFDVFRRTYTYDNLTVNYCYMSEAGYLPKEFIEVILKYYEYKTSLKGVAGAESRYAEAKQFINSIYGVCVTKIITDIVSYFHGWGKTPATEYDYKKAVDNTFKNPPFTTYQIGVWVTAWARHNLWDAIEHFDTKTVYCDTDSIKGLFDDNDMKWFDAYNANILKLCGDVANHYNIPMSMFTPKTPSGKSKEIGFFDREDDCEEFKTLGAKRYVDTVNGEIQCTIAGLPKSAGVAKIKSVDDFNDGIMWDTKESGKLISHYNDCQPICTWIDRDGNSYISYDQYGLNLQPSTFDMKLGEDYAMFLSMLAGDELTDYFDTPEIMRK